MEGGNQRWIAIVLKLGVIRMGRDYDFACVAIGCVGVGVGIGIGIAVEGTGMDDKNVAVAVAAVGEEGRRKCFGIGRSFDYTVSGLPHSAALFTEPGRLGKLARSSPQALPAVLADQTYPTSTLLEFKNWVQAPLNPPNISANEL